MSQPSPFFPRIWLVIPLCALGLLLLAGYARIKRTEYVTARGEPAAVPPGETAAARRLIVPEHLGVSYEWIVEAQHLVEGGAWRVRRIEHENAPFGRPVWSGSPYRWWLAGVASIDRLLSRASPIQSVERAALYSGLILQLLFGAVLTLAAARWFGRLAAALVAIGVVTIFPFAASFVPGAPDENDLVRVVVATSMLLLVRGVTARDGRGAVSSSAVDRPDFRTGASGWFFLSGAAGGLTLWISPAIQMPMVVGVTVGGLLGAWLARVPGVDCAAARIERSAWRAWALGGMAVTFIGYIVECYPERMGGFELRAVHPLYGIAWMGCGELTARIGGLLDPTRTSRRRGDIVGIAFAAIAIASLPIALAWTGNPGPLAIDLLSFRLTVQPDGVMAPNIATWLSQNGVGLAVCATFLPLTILGTMVWLLVRRATSVRLKVALGILAGPLLVALALACVHLRWWQTVDGLLLVALAPVVTAVGTAFSPGRRAAWTAAVVASVGCGVGLLFPARGDAGEYIVTVPEVEALVERDLARWLAKRVDPSSPAVVLAPPSVTNALHYYGGMKGIATLAWENKDGLSVALRIMLSNSPDEAHELVRGRDIKLIVVPSWDPVFEGYVQAASVQTGELFHASLRRWAQPTWLRPLAYRPPPVPGFAEQTVAVFEVQNDQREALALAHLVDFFADTGQTANLKVAAEALKQFPMDFGALVTRTEVEGAMGDPTQFAAMVELVVTRLGARADRGLPWDRRVSLAVVLARAQRKELARQQVMRCIAELTPERIRSLTPSALYHLLALGRALGTEITDPALRFLALDLLPADLRARF